MGIMVLTKGLGGMHFCLGVLNLFFLIVLGTLLVGCETPSRFDAKFDDIIPDFVYRRHSSDSPYPDINQVPLVPRPAPKANDLNIEADVSPDEIIQELSARKQTLQQLQAPMKRDVNEPNWPIDE